MWELRGAHTQFRFAAVLEDRAWLVTDVPAGESLHVQIHRATLGDTEPAVVDHELLVRGQPHVGPNGAVSDGQLLLAWSESRTTKGENTIALEILGPTGTVRELWRESVGSAESVHVSSFPPLVAARASEPGWVVCAPTYEPRSPVSSAHCAVVAGDGAVREWHHSGLPDDVNPLALVRAGGTLHLVAQTSGMKEGVAPRVVAIALKPDASPGADPVEVTPTDGMLHLPVPGGVIFRTLDNKTNILWDGTRARPLEQAPWGADASVVRDGAALLASGEGFWTWTDGAPSELQPWPSAIVDRLTPGMTRRVLPATDDSVALVGWENDDPGTVLVIRPRAP